MKVFKFQFYRLPFTYEQEDRFYKEEHVNLYKINWNSDSVNNQISWDFTDPLNPKIRVVGKLIGYKNNVLVEAENDFNYCYVEYGENPSKLMKQYFFTIPIKRISFNAYEYTLKLDVIMTYWDKFFKHYEKTDFNIQRGTFHHFNSDGSFSYFGMMAYMNCEFSEIDDGQVKDYVWTLFGCRSYDGNVMTDIPGKYSVLSLNKVSRELILKYIDDEGVKKYINSITNLNIPASILVQIEGGDVFSNSSFIIRTTLFPFFLIDKDTTTGDDVSMVLIKNKFFENNSKVGMGIAIRGISNINFYGATPLIKTQMSIISSVYNAFGKHKIHFSYTERMRIENWCFYDGIKKEVIYQFMPPYWPTKSKAPQIEFYSSINNDLWMIYPTKRDNDRYIKDVILWDATLSITFYISQYEQYIKENRFQILNAIAIGDNNIKVTQWEKRIDAAKHGEGIIRGGISGAGTGALVGSIVPGIGTAIGGVVGAIGGALTSGGAISGGMSAYGLGNVRIDGAKLEKQSIYSKIQDTINLNPTIRASSVDYTDRMLSSRFGVFIKRNILSPDTNLMITQYYNRFGSKYNIYADLHTLFNIHTRKYWIYIQTDNSYKFLDDYFPAYIKREFSNILDNGLRLHRYIDPDEGFNFNLLNYET